MSDLIDKQVVLDTIHLFFTEEIDKIPTKKTEDGEVYVIHKCQPLFEMNKAICKRIKALPSVSPTQNCVENALDMRCDEEKNCNNCINYDKRNGCDGDYDYMCDCTDNEYKHFRGSDKE